jgi:glucose/arabinose dehydrogenase
MSLPQVIIMPKISKHTYEQFLTITSMNYKPTFTRKRECFLFLLLLFFSVSLLRSDLYAQTLPSGFSRVQVANGINNPTVMAFAPDGRIFVAQQNGSLRVIKNGALLPAPFIQLSVNSSGERGLIGIALDPNFSTNQYVYLYYTLSNGSRNRVSRFTANGDVAVPGSEVVILNLDPLSSATNHNGGALHFKDGKLFVAVGENANGSHSQNLDTYHGKLLRINPDGSVPAGNPFTTGSEQRRRVWAYGLRNPYTFDVQPGTGRIFVNDVGQSSWEEINDATTGGRNFGWPSAEGNSSNPAFTNPVYAYGRGSSDGVGCAITGGVFFNPATTNYPAQFIGRYFFQDLCSRWINTLTLSGSTATRQSFATGLGGNALGLEVGIDGNLYYLERSTGALFKIIYTNNAAPNIVTHPISQSVSQCHPVTFTVTATGTAPLSYQWQRNGVNISGATAASYSINCPMPSHAGNYRVIVSNAVGSATSNTASLTVTAPNGAPVAQILTPTAGTLYRGGDVINFSGNATDPEDGTLPASAFTWFVNFHHDTHVHDGPSIADGVKSGSFTIPSSGEVSSNVWYRLYLIVTDSQGLKDTTYRDILPHKSNITLVTQPAGLKVTLDGQPVNTPLTVTSVEGIQRTIGAVSPQTLNGKTYVFDKWLHGGAASQTISTPVNDITYTAVYKESTVTSITLEAESATLSGVKVASNHNGYTGTGFVDYIKPSGEYIEWSANVATAGMYSLKFRYAIGSNSSNQRRLQIRVNGTTINAGLVFPSTSSWTNWMYVTITTNLNAGVNTIRATSIGTSGPNLDHLVVESTTTSVLSSIDSDAIIESLSVHPNPSSGQLTIHYLASEGETMEVRLIDFHGRIFLTNAVKAAHTGINSMTVDVRHVTNGMYSLHVKSGKAVTSRAVKIEK